MRKKIRFTDYVNGRHRVITLKQNEMVSFNRGGSTDEGFSFEEVTYHFKGDTVAKTEYSRWRDCDGPGSRDRQWHCKVECLWSDHDRPSSWSKSEKRWVPTGELFKMPAWGKVTRDYWFDAFAEAAGY